MLRVIEYGELERVGGTTTLRVDVRVVAAANMDLPSLAAAGEFRADLLDRLAFNVITIPPLRLRPADILTMAESFAIEASREFGFDAFPGFSPAAEQKLASHLWPGNVRELRNVVERSLCIHGDKASSIGRIDIDPFDSPWRPLGVDVNSKESGDSDRQTAVPTASSSFAETVAAFERSLLEKALSKSRYVQKEAAGRLDLSYHQFRRLLMKHGLLTRS
jgi:psp operon transcriptional activator